MGTLSLIVDHSVRTLVISKKSASSFFGFLCLSLTSLLAWSQPAFETDVSTFLDSGNSGIIAEPNMEILMRDSTKLSLDVYRPSSEGQYPTLYAASPYPHTDDYTAPNNAHTGPVEWFVNQGYNYVLLSSRGTGLSEGDYALLSREEQQDHYEVIEWIAQQDWSNGQVAGVGAGYAASAQWQMAIQNPPHLECIAPYNGVVSPFQDWAFPGGLASTEFTENWYQQQVRLSNAFPNSGPSNIIEYDSVLQQLLHPTYDDYWRLRSSLESASNINIPIFMLRSWDQAEPGLNGTFKALEQLNSTHKILVVGRTQGTEIYQDPEFLSKELLPFYQWCFKQETSSSFIEQPRIRYYVRGQSQIKRDNTWPPGNIEPKALFLNRQSSGSSTSNSLSPSALTNNITLSQYGEDSANKSVQFISEVLEDDLEITGPISLELYASSSASDTGFEVILSEQLNFQQINQTIDLPDFLTGSVDNNDPLITSPNIETSTQTSTTIIVSTGLLKASANMPPPQQIQERVNLYTINLHTTAYRFKQGNRIVLEIRQKTDGSLLNKPSQDSIYHNTRYPTKLWLPMVKKAN